MNTEPIAQPAPTPRRKEGNAIPNDNKDRDSALDEALEESFPASDPVAITVEDRKPPKKP